MTPAEFQRLQRLAACADPLLADKTFLEILADLKSEAIRCWSNALTTEKREEFWYDLQAVQRLENLMRAYGQQYRKEAQQQERAHQRTIAKARFEEFARG
jgi:hypothetical protein